VYVWGAILLTGLIGSAAAFLIQTWAQKHLPAVEAGVIIMSEPLFAAFFGWLFGELLTARQWCGACLMIGSIIVVGLVPFWTPLRKQPQAPAA
jgi:drug/metabolite transporter (DMT)-like permease